MNKNDHKMYLAAGTGHIVTTAALPIPIQFSIVGLPFVLTTATCPENLSDVQTKTFGIPSVPLAIVGAATEN